MRTAELIVNKLYEDPQNAIDILNEKLGFNIKSTNELREKHYKQLIKYYSKEQQQ
jgi:hypothetical protein